MIFTSFHHKLLPVSLLTALICFSGCQSTDEAASSEGQTDRYQVAAETTPFYRLGPQQDAGADLQLGKGTRVTMLKRSFGFSNVELDNGWDGWVATSDIEPATVAQATPGSSLFDNLEGNSAIVGRYPSSGVPQQFEPADLPSPDEAFPETSLLDPQLEPVELPEFRY